MRDDAPDGAVPCAGALRQIYRHAGSAYPQECCGFVYRDGTVHQARNMQDELHRLDPQRFARTSASGYTLSVADTVLLNASMAGPNPVTVLYHSHPDVGAYFSEEDRAKALFAGQPVWPVNHLVVDVQAGQARSAKLFVWQDGDFACAREFIAGPLDIPPGHNA